MAGPSTPPIVVLLVASLAGSAVLAAPTGHSLNYGDWVVECRVSDSGQDCKMNQRVIDGSTQTQLVRFQVVAGEVPQVRFLVPLGVWIDPGIALKIGESEETFSFTYAKCLPEGCIADGPLTTKLLASLEGAREGRILLADRHRKVVGIPFSGQGFGEAYRALKSEIEPDWWTNLQSNLKSWVDKLMDKKP